MPVGSSIDRFNGRTQTLALPIDGSGAQVSDRPLLFNETASLNGHKDSLFVQDEWRPLDRLTVNFGLRYDDVRTTRGDSQISPRISAVWTLPSLTTFHAGYARYFLPAPIDDGGEAPTHLSGTTAAPPSNRGEPRRAETDDYFDVGLQQALGGLTLGVDGYVRDAKNLIDDGQFGAPNVRRSFNYRRGRIRGVEFTATYSKGPFTAWSNLAFARALARGAVSNQFFFAPATLTYLTDHAIHISQDQALTASAGVGCHLGKVQFSGDLIFGSGLRQTATGAALNGETLPAYAQINLAAVYHLVGITGHPLNVRIDLLNAFDARYKSRTGPLLGMGPWLSGGRAGGCFSAWNRRSDDLRSLRPI